jgi:integrase/recombinase XerD
MKVQRIQLPDTQGKTWLVLDDAYLPIPPICSYLQFLLHLDRSPNTIRAAASHLKLFWEYVHAENLCWKEIDVGQLAGFIPWLRRDNPTVVSLAIRPARRTNATIDQILSTVHSFYAFHIRLHTVKELPLYQFTTPYRSQYKPFLHGIAKTKPEQTRIVSVKGEKRKPKTLTTDQIQALFNACTHTRDRFLMALAFGTGMRIGQILGLRHSDICVEKAEIQIIPRTDNPNGARAKSRFDHTIPVREDLLELYIDYLVQELDALDGGVLPEFVFVNLWEGERGRPMTYAAVMSLVKRLCKKTGIRFTPHMLRHSRATIWIRDDKLPLLVVSRLLTHASIQTTNDIYLELTASDLRKAMKERKEENNESGTYQ